jgi:hypothetical protein
MRGLIRKSKEDLVTRGRFLSNAIAMRESVLAGGEGALEENRNVQIQEK